jgi:hypothetical protein
MLYQRKTLLTGENIGTPAALPAALIGLNDASLADLSAAIPDAAGELGYEGEGFFPFTPEPQPAPEPAPVPLNKIDFLRLFLQGERIAIREAAKVNPIIADYQDMLDAAGVVLLTDPDIVAGVPLLETAGLLGAGRAVQILAGEAPA